MYQGPTARLAQSVERKALNLVVVGSSPTVGDFDLVLLCRGADTTIIRVWVGTAPHRFVCGALQRGCSGYRSNCQAVLVRLHRLAVRTSRCGRDDPGSNPGVDIFAR